MLTIRWKFLAVATGLAVLAACTPEPPPQPLPPPPPPPPPPVVQQEAIPYRPIPPRGAAYMMEIPRSNGAGVRETINFGLDEYETVWHFRSGWNVAALNCLGPQDEAITSAYGEFLRRFPRGLASANREMERKFRRDHSSSRAAIRAREEHSTQVYNYFALPGARADFCAAARHIASQFPSYEGDDVKDYAALNLPLLENAFESFFAAYEEYEQLSAEWDRQYGAQYGASQPGYVAIYGSREETVGSALMTDQPETLGEVLDPDTGALIPLIPAGEGNVRTPVVQPLPDDSDAQ